MTPALSSVQGQEPSPFLCTGPWPQPFSLYRAMTPALSSVLGPNPSLFIYTRPWYESINCIIQLSGWVNLPHWSICEWWPFNTHQLADFVSQFPVWLKYTVHLLCGIRFTSYWQHHFQRRYASTELQCIWTTGIRNNERIWHLAGKNTSQSFLLELKSF